ncbi:MAG: hypothetical protein JWM88_1140, partial [Verrucomicrobia bacterium]|nr:hypothetical protein [Verrucomicrobiota bacterium]
MPATLSSKPAVALLEIHSLGAA